MTNKKRAGMIVHERHPYNAETPRSELLPRITATDSFYVRNHGPVPDIIRQDWAMVVDGLVSCPLRLGFDELKQLGDLRSVTATMQCAGNRRAGLNQVKEIAGEAPWGPGATSTAVWTGVSLVDVLAAAGVRAEGRHVAFTAPDVAPSASPPQAYGSSIELSKATSPEVILAWEMNGENLPAEHGGPVRVVVPGYIGARSVKWIEHIEVRSCPSDNFFQSVAYRLLPAEADPSSEQAGQGIALSSVALNSEILAPEDGALVSAGRNSVLGYAYAGDDRYVVRVDVSVDGGRTWSQAQLEDPASAWAWQQWRIRLNLRAGQHTLMARAWDNTGACQPESARTLWNPKGYINNSWAQITVDVR